MGRIREVKFNSPSYEFYKPLRKLVMQTFGERFLEARGGPELDLVPAKVFDYVIPEGVGWKGAAEDIVSRVHANMLEVVTLDMVENNDIGLSPNVDDDDLSLLLALPNLKAIYIVCGGYFDWQDMQDDRSKRLFNQIEASVELVTSERLLDLIEEIKRVAKGAGQLLFSF